MIVNFSAGVLYIGVMILIVGSMTGIVGRHENNRYRIEFALKVISISTVLIVASIFSIMTDNVVLCVI
jgi:hypothetical protein